MKSLEDVLIHVWQQAMVEGARSVEMEEHSYPVKNHLYRIMKQVDAGTRYEAAETVRAA